MLSRVFSVYIFLGVVTGIYQTFWGRLQYESMGSIFGRCLLWPVVWFPSLGAVIGGLIFVVLILALVFTRRI